MSALVAAILTSGKKGSLIVFDDLWIIQGLTKVLKIGDREFTAEFGTIYHDGKKVVDIKLDANVSMEFILTVSYIGGYLQFNLEVPS
jgi:hypothetical protein